MAKVVQFSPERAVDRIEIQHRIYQFCRAADRLDLESARDAFHPDAFDDHGVFKGGVDGLFDWIRERHRTLPFSYHHVGNIFVEFSGPDEAMCESYVLTWQSTGPGGPEGARAPEMFAAGRYVDQFTRRDGAWRIAKRISFPEATMQVTPVAATAMTSHPGWARPTRDEQDPSQVLRRELGLRS